MVNHAQEEAWNDVKNMWNTSSEVKEIKITMSELMDELKAMTSQFEKDLINKDIQLIKESISEFEKKTLKKEIEHIEDSISEWEKDLVKSGINSVTRIIKKFTSIFKSKNNKE